MTDEKDNEAPYPAKERILVEGVVSPSSDTVGRNK